MSCEECEFIEEKFWPKGFCYCPYCGNELQRGEEE